MKIQIFVQARMGSTRLFGKVLMKLGGKSILCLLLERLKRARGIDKIVVLTTGSKKDDCIVREAKKCGVDYFRGSEMNVLDRYYQASQKFKPEAIIRVTADCPLIDFNLINRAVKIFNRGGYDVVSNNRVKTYPHGFNFEIFSASALAVAWKFHFAKFHQNKKEFDSADINPTRYLLNSEKFKNKDIIYARNLYHIRLTLDYQEDFVLIKKIYQKLYRENKSFGFKEIMGLLRKEPELLNINKKYV